MPMRRMRHMFSRCIRDRRFGEGVGNVSAHPRRQAGRRDESIPGIRALSRENFQSYKSKIRRELLAAFGQSRLAELEIAAAGSRPDTRYGIRLDRHRIRMEW